MKMTKNFALCFASASLMFLTACGDDSGTSSDSKESSESDLIVDTFDDLVVCSEKREGVVAYVKDEKTEYSCIDGKWTADDGEELSSSSVILSSSGESSSSIASSSSAVSSSSKTVPSSSSIASSSSKAISSSSKALSSSSQESNVLKDSRDGKSYKTVTIGTQTWMAQNLNYTPDTTKYAGYKGRTWCYNNSLDSCAKFGRLYTWAAAMDSAAVFSENGKGCGYGTTCTVTEPVRGICPEGWYLPGFSDWNTLFTFVGGASTAGTKLKSTSGWSASGNGDDSYSFSALPAGGRDYSGLFYNAGDIANIWSSLEDDSNYAGRILLINGSDAAPFYNINKDYGFSVRCLKNSN